MTTLMSTRILTLLMRDNRMSSKNYDADGYGHELDLPIVVCSTVYPTSLTWVQREKCPNNTHPPYGICFSIECSR